MALHFLGEINNLFWQWCLCERLFTLCLFTVHTFTLTETCPLYQYLFISLIYDSSFDIFGALSWAGFILCFIFCIDHIPLHVNEKWEEKMHWYLCTYLSPQKNDTFAYDLEADRKFNAMNQHKFTSYSSWQHFTWFTKYSTPSLTANSFFTTDNNTVQHQHAKKTSGVALKTQLEHDIQLEEKKKREKKGKKR